MFQTMLNIFLNIFFNIKKIYINNSVKLNIFNSVKSNILFLIVLIFIFILFIFNIYLEIKKYIQILSEIKFSYNKNNKFKSIIKFQSRNFSTSAFNSNNYENDPELKANRLELIKRKPEDKIKTLKAFKKAYGGGFLGYSHIYNFGNITQFTSYKNRLEYGTCKSNLEIKLKDYISIIPETETYSILPVLRWEYSGGGYRSLTISYSIKINKNISISLLAEAILNQIKKMFSKYNLLDGDLELYIMGRP